MCSNHSACYILNTEFMEENKRAVFTLHICWLFSCKHPFCHITYDWELMTAPLLQRGQLLITLPYEFIVPF